MRYRGIETEHTPPPGSGPSEPAPLSWRGRRAGRASASGSEGTTSCQIRSLGRLAQLGEHQLDKLGVTGSSPVPPIAKGLLSGPFCFLYRRLILAQCLV